MMDYLGQLIKLSRWKQHLPFTLAISLFAYCVGIKSSGVEFDLIKFLLIFVAISLSISFAFIINEIEDAEDDEKIKGKKNTAYLYAKSMVFNLYVVFFTVLIPLLIFATYGTNTLFAGGLLLLLAFLYSWKKIRLKALPVVDLASHSLMLAGLIFLLGYFIASDNISYGLPLFIASIFASLYGQFYNQIRDFEADKKVKLNNTSILIGKKTATILMYFCLIILGIIILYSFYIGILPIWILVLAVILSPLMLKFKGKNSEERDIYSGVPTNTMHFPFLLAINVLAIIFSISIILEI